MFSFEGIQVKAGCPQDSRCRSQCLADDAGNGCMPENAPGGAAGRGWDPLAGSRPADQRCQSAGSDSGPPAWSPPAPMCMLTKKACSLQSLQRNQDSMWHMIRDYRKPWHGLGDDSANCSLYRKHQASVRSFSSLSPPQPAIQVDIVMCHVLVSGASDQHHSYTNMRHVHK